MTNEPVDQRKLLESALREQQWTFAKTMASMPHEYVLQDRWVGSLPFALAVEWLNAFGISKQWMKRTYTYFYANGYRYWAMPAIKPGTFLINRAVE